MTGHVGFKSDHGMTTSKETGTCNSSEWNFAKKELGKGFLVCCFFILFYRAEVEPKALCMLETYSISKPRLSEEYFNSVSRYTHFL